MCTILEGFRLIRTWVRLIKVSVQKMLRSNMISLCRLHFFPLADTSVVAKSPFTFQNTRQQYSCPTLPVVSGLPVGVSLSS
jgi:hypothetical protein